MTAHIQRFGDAMALLCGGVRPSDEILLAWLSHSDDRLQSFACNHTALSWSQGIAIIEAAESLASQPAEGEGHEPPCARGLAA